MDICTCRAEVIYSSVHQTEKKTSSQSYNFSHAFRCKSQTVPGLEIQTYEYVNGLSNASSVYWMLKLLHMHSHTLTEEVPTGSSAARASVSCPKTSDLPSTGRAARPPELQPAHVRVFIFNGRYNVHTFIKIYIYGTPRSKRTQNVKIKQCLLAVTLKWSSYSVGCWIYWTWNLHVELLQLQPKMLVDGDVSSSPLRPSLPTKSRRLEETQERKWLSGEKRSKLHLEETSVSLTKTTSDCCRAIRSRRLLLYLYSCSEKSDKNK